MEIIELTKKNIKTYLEQTLKLQEFLVSDPSGITSRFFEETAKDSHSFFLALVEGNMLLGVGVLSKMTHPVNITAYINNIVVHPDARGKGLFTVIMDTLEMKAKEWGCTDVALTCSREKVQGMYEKRGYTQKKTNFYLLKI